MTLFDLGDVSATSLITLYCHAMEMQSEEPLLQDPKAVEITQELNKTLSESDNTLDRVLAGGKLNRNLVVHIALRAKKYDAYVKDFLEKSPEGIVVNIGCGLDSRFLRIDNGKVLFYDLDLPEVIELKRRFFQESPRYHFISSSVLDYDWISRISNHRGPFLFVAEGVFMYLHENDVKSLVLELQKEFPGCELVCEVVNSLWLTAPLKKLMNYKLRRQHLGKDVVFHSGIRDSREMEQWNAGIQFLDEWSYFDSEEKKLGWLRILKHSELFRKTQWTVHYKLG